MSKESRQDNMEHAEQNAGAAARVDEKRRRESPLALPSGSEWENLVADIGALRLRDFRIGDTRHHQSQLPSSRSDDNFYLARRKYVSDLEHEGVQVSHPGTAAVMTQHGSGASGFYLGYGVEGDDDDSGLGSPPPAPPTLKRTRAYSSSPKRRRKFRDDDDFSRQ